MKKIINILIIISIVFSNLFIIDVNALTTKITATVNDPEGVYLRKGPSTDNDIITLLSYGKSVTLVSTKKHNGKGCDGGWYQVNYNGSTSNYLCSLYVSVKTTSYDSNYYTTSSWNSRINEDYATVRESPNGTVIEKIYLGTDVKVLQTTGDWAKISYYNNRTGYILKRLVSNYNDITAYDKDYYEELKEKGFPDSYLPFLTYLHKKHPNWVFKADKTKKDFNKAVDNEVGKNYIQSKEDAYRVSDKVKENPNWYAASMPVVAFFLDPRNYLTERNIFSFEELTYDEKNHTKDLVKSAFSGTYLETDEYAGYFIEAAKRYNVSPVHLATRVTQEGGANSKYAAITGTATSVSKLTYDGKNLDGFYNYYNIGAYEDDKTDSSVTRGLAAAAGIVDDNEGTPWDTREKAIIYGAKFIAEGYIAKKQNTLYYQKFNTVANAYYPPYTHQYMTNIIAPLSEGLDTYYSYDDLNLLDSTFTFIIPIYENMPDGFTSHPIIGDTNNNLKSISINNTPLSGFDSDVLDYTYYLNSNINEVTLAASAESKTATISGTGKITIDKKEKEVKIIVTSETGNEKIYKINFIKTESEVKPTDKTVDQVLENVDIKLNKSYMSGIKEKTTASNLNNSITSINPDVSITITDKNNKVSSGILKTGDKITIKTSIEEKTFTIVIKGDNNGDGIINALDLLRVQKHILKYSTLSNEYLESCDTNYDGVVNPLDLLRVQKHILKYIVLK